jgi:hypothetical protein
MGHISAFGNIFNAKSSDKLNHLDKEFSVGDVVSVRVVKQAETDDKGFRNYELKLASAPEYTNTIGSIVTARVLKINK